MRLHFSFYYFAASDLILYGHGHSDYEICCTGQAKQHAKYQRNIKDVRVKLDFQLLVRRVFMFNIRINSRISKIFYTHFYAGNVYITL